MSELGRVRDRGENTLVPDLLGWMGAAFGDAVERAGVRPLRLGSAQMEDVIRALPAAIYTTDAAGRITFYNEAAAELWGCRPELGKSEFCGSWKLYWPDGRPMPHGQCPMALALKEQREVRGMEAVAERPDGYPCPFRSLSNAPVRCLGHPHRCCEHAESTSPTANAPTCMRSGLHQLSNRQTTRLSARTSTASLQAGMAVPSGCSAIGPEEVIGKPITILIPADRIDEEPEIIERVRRGERVDHYDTVRRRKDGSLIDISLTVSPLKDADGRIVGASKIARDITERKRAQEQQRLLVKEMKHRIKNSLATVQAIATQTLNQHAEERDAFIARLHALGNAHDLLTSETWQAASLQAIVTQALKPFQEQHHERIAVEGPANVWLDSTKSVVVAMVVHELATNALKYGALSNGSGRVSVAWKQHSQPNLVKLVWQESGGPEISPPQRKGFGSHLIERAFGGQLGTAQLVFSPQGLSCTLEVELTDAHGRESDAAMLERR